MPLFGRHNHEQPPVEANPPTRHSTMNSGRTSTSSVDGQRRGLFGSRRTSSPETVDTMNSRSSSHGNGGFLRRGHQEDGSITAARQRVIAAETAERDADAALHSARLAVREARDHVKHLEREAAEEYVVPNKITNLNKSNRLQGSSCKDQGRTSSTNLQESETTWS